VTAPGSTIEDTTFAWIAEERRDLAVLLEGLSSDQLVMPSLCARWTVHDVFAHLLMPLVTPTATFVRRFVSSGFDFDKANLKLTANVAQRSDAEIATGLREHAADRFTPPGMGATAPLTDALVHGMDIRYPLGLDHRAAPERVRACLEFLTGSNTKGFVPKALLTGVSLHADDLDWEWGSGPQASGPGHSLLMVITGRPAGLNGLTGDGTDLLRTRLT